MRTILASAAIGVTLFALSFTPAAAQQAERAAAFAACTVPPVSATACNLAMEAFLAAVAGLPAADADALIADLVFDLANAATPETRAAIGAAIVLAAAAVQDPSRADAVLEVADLVLAGQSFDDDSVDTLASPS